ncbi:MAG TPA: glycosyltransferase [Solirubrobacterales bacterium]
MLRHRDGQQMPDGGETTVIFSNVRADHLVQRHHYVARWLAGNGRSIWVDTLGSRNPRPADLRRIGGERAGQSPETLLPGVEVVKPRFVPLFGPPFYGLNRRLLERQLDDLGVDPGRSTAWVYLPHPVVLDLLRQRKWGRVVFDLCDDIDDMDVHPALRAGETELLKKADVVFATAEALVEKARRVRGGEVHYVANGVDSARFGEQFEPPGKLRRVLYVGAIYEWLDEDLIVAVAAGRPDLEFRIVGPVRRPLPRLEQMANVTVPGPVAAERVPQEIAAAQLCMIPFRPGPLTEATDPLKLYEALIAGRPVLATALHQGERFAPAVRLETDAEGWLQALADLDSGAWSIDAAALRERVAREEDWRARFASMERALSDETALA